MVPRPQHQVKPSLRQLVKTRREQKGWTSAELARKAGLPRSTISRIENGITTPTLQTVGQILRALGIGRDTAGRLLLESAA